MKLPAHSRKALLLTAAMLHGKHFHSRNKKWWFGWKWLLFTIKEEKTKRDIVCTFQNLLTITLKWKTDTK